MYRAYEGDVLIGTYDTEEEAEEAIRKARREAGVFAKSRLYGIDED